MSTGMNFRMLAIIGLVIVAGLIIALALLKK